MKLFINSLIFFVAFFVLIGASLYGVITPDNTPVAKVGSMQLAPFKNGLSLYQGYRGYYYTLSPFNDYLITNDGVRQTYISNKELSEKKFKSSYKNSHWDDIIQTVKSYLDVPQPTISFNSKRSIGYEAEISENSVIVKNFVILADQEKTPKILGSTMSWQASDIVFDKTGNLYNYLLLKDIENFANTYGIKLHQDLGELRVPVAEGKIVIVNPSLSSVLVVKALPNQRMFINREWRLVELEQKAPKTDTIYRTSIKIELYESPKEAIKAL